MKIAQELLVIYGILSFVSTPEEILQHTSASRYTGWETLYYRHVAMCIIRTGRAVRQNRYVFFLREKS